MLVTGSLSVEKHRGEKPAKLSSRMSMVATYYQQAYGSNGSSLAMPSLKAKSGTRNLNSAMGMASNLRTLFTSKNNSITIDFPGAERTRSGNTAAKKRKGRR